jgi:hypothetical protein
LASTLGQVRILGNEMAAVAPVDSPWVRLPSAPKVVGEFPVITVLEDVAVRGLPVIMVLEDVSVVEGRAESGTVGCNELIM